MTSERGNPEIFQTFKSYGGWARKVQDASYINKERSPNAVRKPDMAGQPDYLCILPRGVLGTATPLGMAIEAKSDNGACHFQFSDISGDQRHWLNKHNEFSWIWLWMGDGRAPDGRSAYCIPWNKWEELEFNFIALYKLKGIAWKTPKQLEHRELGLSAEGLLSYWKLEWENKHWLFPTPHPVWIW